MKTSKMYIPNPKLLSWIKYYWLIEGKSNNQNYLNEYILPDGCATILIILNGKIKLSAYENREITEGIYIIPPIMKSHKNLISNDIYCIDIQLKPGIFYKLFDFPVNEFDLKVYNFTEISRSFDTNILYKLMELKDSRFLMMNELNEFFMKLFYITNFNPGEVILGLRQLYQDGNLENFYSGQTKSERHVQRKVKSMTGLTPKKISRIGRFYNILESSSGKYEELKHAQFFTDQSHLIKEFKYFTGLTPKSFINKELNYLQYDAIINKKD